MTLKTIEAFNSTVDPNKSTVVSFPEFIAIFGGSFSLKKRSKPKTQRGVFYWWILENRQELKDSLLIPENYEDWNDFDTYSDLLLFEKDLGYLTSAVLVFLESPGSIAELGAFSQIDSLSEHDFSIKNFYWLILFDKTVNNFRNASTDSTEADSSIV
ncbi:MAG: retron St85 family effector protein [Nitrosomonas sp.]|nr:retron St85 family effector protein [Nitrosomonas sp.]